MRLWQCPLCDRASRTPGPSGWVMAVLELAGVIMDVWVCPACARDPK